MIDIALAGLFIADGLAQFNIPQDYPRGLVQGVKFFVVLIIGYLVGKTLILPVVERILGRYSLDRHAKQPLRKIVWLAYIFAVVGFAFGFAGFGSILRSLATIAAAATLAIGFAMQDVIKNFVAGIFIFTDKPFRIGDWIEWDDYSGVVEDISLRVTRVRTFDNELLTVPNSQLTDGTIKNPVKADKLRLKFVFGIGYDDDIDQATNIIIEEAENHSGILDDPAPGVRLTELADSYIGLQSRIWIGNPSRSDFVRIRGEYVQNVKERFDQADIEIPFPQRDLSGELAVGDSIGD